MTTHEKALALSKRLSEINEGSIPVISRDTMLLRKKRAALTRAFFKTLGIKGVRVRLAKGANCFWVDLIIPQLDHDRALHTAPNKSFVDCLRECPGCIYRERTALSLEEILQRAFPKEVDNSDPQSDYFDYPWGIHYYE